MKTIGVSNKMLTTVLAASGAQLVAFAVNFISTGQFDRVELAQLVGVGLTAVFGVILGASAQPDQVGFDPDLNVPGGGESP